MEAEEALGEAYINSNGVAKNLVQGKNG